MIAPRYPGWGSSPPIDGMGLVDDLAYLYLDLAEVMPRLCELNSTPRLAVAVAAAA